MVVTVFFFFQAEDGIRDVAVTGVQTCALPISPAEAIAHTVVLHGAPIGVPAEGFALAGDVHLWLGNLAPEDYTVPTPDGRPATRQFAGERLARVICADRELLDEAAIDAIARSLADAQIGRVSAALERVARRHPGAPGAGVTGPGAFIAAAGPPARGAGGPGIHG